MQLLFPGSNVSFFFGIATSFLAVLPGPWSYLSPYLRAMYRLLRGFFFLFEAERAHYMAMSLFRAICALGPARRLLKRQFQSKHPGLHRTFLGLNFRNPVGLGAGFDKNALYLRELDTLGFGFVEIGTVTSVAQEGNERPRLFRLEEDGALLNRMGFNNHGLHAVAGRLKAWREGEVHNTASGMGATPPLIVGGNIGKNKATPNEDAWKDYETCFRALHPYVDFFVVNVSSPNTPGLRELQEKEALRGILTHLQNLDIQQKEPKPILLKIAPDLTWAQVDDVIQLSAEIDLDGIVATNTTISRAGLTANEKDLGAGGISGKPLAAPSTEVIRYIAAKTAGKLPLIGSGGVFTGPDAQEKLTAGATLVEVWTGFIYEGPLIAKRICEFLNR